MQLVRIHSVLLNLPVRITYIFKDSSVNIVFKSVIYKKTFDYSINMLALMNDGPFSHNILPYLYRQT